MNKNLSINEKVNNEVKFSVSNTLVDYIYNQLKNVELANLITSVTIKQLNEVKRDKVSLSAFLSKIESANTAIESDNLKLLESAFASAFKSAPVMEVEKFVFLRKLAKVRKATKLFSITFQDEQNTDTIGNTESGLTPYRKTTISAAGLRTCFNSYDIFRDEVARTARKQANEKQLQRASASLAASLGIDASLLTPELLAKFGFTRVCKVD